MNQQQCWNWRFSSYRMTIKRLMKSHSQTLAEQTTHAVGETRLLCYYSVVRLFEKPSIVIKLLHLKLSNNYWMYSRKALSTENGFKMTMVRKRPTPSRWSEPNSSQITTSFISLSKNRFYIFLPIQFSWAQAFTLVIFFTTEGRESNINAIEQARPRLSEWSDVSECVVDLCRFRTCLKNSIDPNRVFEFFGNVNPKQF